MASYNGGAGTLDGAVFEENWALWTPILEDSRPFSPPSQMDALESLVQIALEEKVPAHTLASGFLPEESLLKFYLYGYCKYVDSKAAPTANLCPLLA